MRKFAVNIIGYVTDESDRYDRDAVIAIMNRPEVTDCFKPLKVVEVVVQTMKSEHTISTDKVSTKKLSQI
jgi:1,4-dihydroxy-2-naphthoyl-CoA synthase